MKKSYEKKRRNPNPSSIGKIWFGFLAFVWSARKRFFLFFGTDLNPYEFNDISLRDMIYGSAA